MAAHTAPDPAAPSRLTTADERTLGDAAGQLAGAIYAAADQPLLREMLAEALDGVDRVRGRTTPRVGSGPPHAGRG